MKLQSTATAPIEYHDYMGSLKKYLSFNSDITDLVPAKYENADFSIMANGYPLTHSWRNIVSVGQASDLLLSDVQASLREAQEKISFRYIFFNGILSDTLFFYQQNLQGKSIYNYVYIDRIFDFLCSIKLKPMISFSYMPRDLAKYPDHFLFNHLVSEPRNMNVWCELIHNFMQHIIKRYGIDEILSWRFSVWHQPNTPTRLYGFENTNSFFNFYKQTRAVVKSFSESISFGLPCMYYLDEPVSNDFITGMINWCREQNCLPDYFNYTFYDAILNHARNKTKDSFGFVDSMTLNPNSDGLKQAISRMQKLRQRCDLASLPIYISEWNNTPSQQDYLNDTCFKSCYIVKNILENYDRLDGLGYWSLTDLLSEHTFPEELFFGGLGLFTVNGIPKASFYAMRMMHHLGDTLLGRGEGWFATKTDHDIRIITYHYKHYTELYSVGERFDMTPTDRYTMFEPSEDFKLSLDINDMAEGTYQVKEYILNREHGSSYDSWVRSGCFEFKIDEECEYLKNSSQPMLHSYNVTTQNNTLHLDISMKVLEVRLLIIK